MKYSQTEIQHLTISWIAISLAFAIAETGVKDFSLFIIAIIFSAITVGIGFIAHELAHKYLAQKYGAFAEFRADFQMLLFAVLISFTGFIFAAPGAVVIAGHISKNNYGKVSAAGPATNFIVALIFGIAVFASGGILKSIASYGFTINSWLGLFNLIPFGNFDGIKIMHWNKIVYAALVVVGFVLVGMSGFL